MSPLVRVNVGVREEVVFVCVSRRGGVARGLTWYCEKMLCGKLMCSSCSR